MNQIKYTPWLQLFLLPGMTSLLYHKLLQIYKSPEMILGSSLGELEKTIGLRSKLLSHIAHINDFSEDVKRELDEIEHQQCHLLCIEDEDYPQNLKNLPHPPPLMYVKGCITKAERCSISIVGSRQCSQYGKTATKFFTETLVRAGLSIISGFARGIDSIAHQSAIEQSGRTVAILGNGLGICYPPENKKLMESISENGALISTFRMSQKPEKYNFPERNYYLAGFSLATLVIEATEKSGALITANFALDEGRMLFALPGDIFKSYSKGTNQLLRQGAILAQTPQDVLEDLSPQIPELTVPSTVKNQQQERQARNEFQSNLSQEEKEILDLIAQHPQTLDEIVDYFEEKGLSFGQVTLWLLNLQMHDHIRQLPGNTYVQKLI